AHRREEPEHDARGRVDREETHLDASSRAARRLTVGHGSMVPRAGSRRTAPEPLAPRPYLGPTGRAASPCRACPVAARIDSPPTPSPTPTPVPVPVPMPALVTITDPMVPGGDEACTTDPMFAIVAGVGCGSSVHRVTSGHACAGFDARGVGSPDACAKICSTP